MLDLRMTARNDQDFVLTRDLSEAAKLYDMSRALIRMQIYSGPNLAFEWRSFGAPGVIAYNAKSKSARFTAQKSIIASLVGSYSVLATIEMPIGIVTLFVGQITFSASQVVKKIATNASDIYALGDTVRVVFSHDIPGPSLSDVSSHPNINLDGSIAGLTLMML